MSRQQSSGTAAHSADATRSTRNLRAGSAAAARAPRPVSRSTDPSVSDAIRVLCVDDHEILVEGLKAQFAIGGGVEVVGRLATAAKLVDEVTRLAPDAVLLDIEMPGPDAFEMADRLKRAHPDVRIIVLSAHIRDAFIAAAFASGVCAYFAKSDELDDIVRGIHEVMRSRPGNFVLGPKVRERCRPIAIDGPRDGIGSAPVGAGCPATRLSTLTAREADILRLIGKGMSRVQIATELCRSPKTIDAHQNRMMKKIGITSRAELMRFAIREGLAQV
jgi:DNA-binding NarL/FixJ family response regulator